MALVYKPILLNQLLETLKVIAHKNRNLVICCRVAILISRSLWFIPWIFYFTIVSTNEWDTATDPISNCVRLHNSRFGRMTYEVFGGHVVMVGVTKE